MSILHSTFSILHSRWLPNMDLNHDKQIQSLLCYHYTIRHARCGKKTSPFGRSVKANPREGISNQWSVISRFLIAGSLITDYSFVIRASSFLIA